MKIRKIVTAILIISLLIPAPLLAEKLAIIVNNSVDVSMLSKSEVKKIFLGKKTTWDKGGKIVISILKKKSDTHKKFLKTYVKKNPSQYSNFWKKLVFTGKGKMPKNSKSENAMVKFVSTTKNAVGYISLDTKSEAVKKITIQ